jgi:nucleotide-binding universal stress UspA family protein
MTSSVLVWIVEGTWQAAVDAARAHAPAGADLKLLHVVLDDAAGTAHGSYARLLGRGHPERDPGRRVAELALRASEELLDAAAQRLGLPAVHETRTGRPEREVVRAAAGAGLLVCARDGEVTRPGPHSLGHATRFVVDHAACPVLLVWPRPPEPTLPEPPPPPPA